MSPDSPLDAAELYARAQAEWRRSLPRSAKNQADLSPQQLLEQELQIHKLALEIQRQELHLLEQKLANQVAVERTQLEELRTSARILDASQNIAKVGGVELHVPSRQIYWTAETYHIHDTTPEEYTPSLDEGFSMYPPGSRERIATALKRAMDTGEVFDIEVEKYTFKGRKIDLRTTCMAHYENGELIRLTGIYQDISERKQAERRHQHHNRILEMLIAKMPLTNILPAIAKDMAGLLPGSFCSIMLLDNDGQHLRNGATYGLPDFFVKAIDGLPVGEGMGVCGSAVFFGHRVIIPDVHTHPWTTAFSDLAERAHIASCWSQPIYSAQGQVLGTFALYNNEARNPTDYELGLIDSETRLTSLAIEQSHAESRLQMAASVFTHAREGILITDCQGNIIEANQVFADITGYSREEALGKNPRFLQSGLHDKDFYSALWQSLLQTGNWYGEVWNRRKNGELYAAMMTISAVQDIHGITQNYVNLFTDITPLKEHQRQLEYIAHYDALTGLPNRVLLADRLKQAMARSHRSARSLAVLYLDLDGFKAVNDQHGHDTGDQLLVNISHRLKEVLREGDTLARIGGDEFVVVMVDLERPQDYEAVLNRLLSVAAEPVTLNQHLLLVSASIGATLYPQDDADADQLLRHADQAMYLAKQAGKNCYHLFDIAKDIAVKTQRESLEHIRIALDRKEFVLHYQPQVNMRTGEIVGAEALVRWQHPERGLLSPAHFLPVIEDHPLSIELGDWVINDALQQIAHWQRLGLLIPVSVNIGALQLQRSEFVTQLAAQLAAHPQVPPAYLQLEIVETSALEDIAEVADIMRRCRDLGVSFAVDDFGTGYSSLTYLKRLPAELLKIDQTFVRDMLDDADDLAIVKGVIGLANAFHRQVIAEGVETVAHGELLIPLGCELAQGYGIARPMPAADLPAWAANWKPALAWTMLHRLI
ncbi:EAL domain-containing protein [Cellvibrio sp. KY-GH-1]|uniref:EAL domain-containing protein n=1 Tax=Cellvibrio sp. KY-GH-1 TaxID=2303332 RepID=UPI001243D1D4|nr:EAL domain-containing protein [Cellvibrio sp. KY-GH-1]QEY18250.1 EAL domain-containing protein [Cellvibrio sp. KY-GH-1]